MEDKFNKKINYRYLDMDNEILYDNQKEYEEALRDRKGKAIERSMINEKYNQVLIAAGIKRNDFGEFFTEIEAILLCKKLSKVN